MDAIRFKLVTDKVEIPAEAFVRPEFIELIVDGKPFHGQEVTQISMRSGHKFFVNHKYEDVIKMLKGEK